VAHEPEVALTSSAADYPKPAGRYGFGQYTSRNQWSTCGAMASLPPLLALSNGDFITTIDTALLRFLHALYLFLLSVLCAVCCACCALCCVVSSGSSSAPVPEADQDEEDVFQPSRGNVAFGSASDGWAFRLDQFADMYSAKLGAKPAALVQVRTPQQLHFTPHSLLVAMCAPGCVRAHHVCPGILVQVFTLSWASALRVQPKPILQFALLFHAALCCAVLCCPVCARPYGVTGATWPRTSVW
jgi:hypothetical protein